MTLDDISEEIASAFYGVAINPAHHRRSEAVVICTGALGVIDSPPPVLCANREIAIELYRRTLSDYIAENTTTDDIGRRVLTWVQEPRVIRFEMTIKEVSGVHRVATARFAVYSSLLIGEPTEVPVSSPIAVAAEAPKPKAKAAPKAKPAEPAPVEA